MTNKFIEIVPNYCEPYLFRKKQNYMALPVNSIIQDFDIVEYSIFDPNGLMNKSQIIMNKKHFDKKVRIVVIKNIFKWLKYLYENRNSAVIFVNSRILSSFVAGLICKKTIFMSHQSPLPNGFIKRNIFRFFIKKFKKIKVSNPYEKKELVKIGVDYKKIFYQPLAIEYQFHKSYDKSLKNIKKIRNKYKIDSKDRIVLYLGNIRRFKNPYNLLKAIKEAILVDENIRLLIIGEDQLYNESSISIKDYAKKLGISENVILTGNLPPEELTKFYSIAEIGVIPSFHEGQCIVAYEFASINLPMCLSSIGSFTSVFGDSALFSKPHDYKKLAQNILKYLNDKKLRKDHAMKNFKIVKERCDYDIVRSKLRDLFISLK